MKKEIIINATSTEIRVALTEDERLAELFLELPDKERHIGSIYLGRVERVVQGMNAAFVDIGLEQHAFLHFSDAAKAGEDFSELLTDEDEENEDEENEDEVVQQRKTKKSDTKSKSQRKKQEEERKAEKKPSAQKKALKGSSSKEKTKEGREDRQGADEEQSKRAKSDPRKDEKKTTDDSPAKKSSSRRPRPKRNIPKEAARKETEEATVNKTPDKPQRPKTEEKSGSSQQRGGSRNRQRESEAVSKTISPKEKSTKGLLKKEEGDQSKRRESSRERSQRSLRSSRRKSGEQSSQETETIGVTIKNKQEESKSRRSRSGGTSKSSRQPKEEKEDKETKDVKSERPAPKTRSSRQKLKRSESQNEAKRKNSDDSSGHGSNATTAIEGGTEQQSNKKASSTSSRSTSTRRRSSRRNSSTKKTRDTSNDKPKRSRRMDAQLPTFQTKRFGEITISLEKGQEILTQVTRESYATKGVKISTKIALPGRFLVLMPHDPGVGISRKVQDSKERRRLRGIARKMLPEGFGCIIRTVAQDKDSEMLEQELQMLLDRWKAVDERLKNAKAPMLLYKDQSVTNTVMRDLFTPDISRVVIDNKGLYQEIRDYVTWAAPPLIDKIEHYGERAPIFQAFGIEKELDKMFASKVWLSTGGYIILEQTEAMMVIDVNSGRYAKEKEQELNALKINLESAREIARQIRLRDIGGLIVIDFIDLYDEKNRKKVYDELKKELSRDRAKSVALPMTQFGIIQMTRQRVRQQLVQTMSEPCPTCNGKGIVQSKSTILRRIEGWLAKFRSETREFRLTLTANPHIIEFLTEGDTMSRLTKLMLKYFVRIKVVPDEPLDMEIFRFFSVRRQEDITQEYMPK